MAALDEFTSELDDVFHHHPLTRRAVLRAGAAAGLFAVVGCQVSSPSQSTAPTGSASGAPSESPEASALVNPGKLTLLVPELGSGRFDVGLVGFAAAEQQYGKLVHGALVASAPNLEKAPGILSAWSLSPDGLEWKLTFRDGLKFHDGRDVTMPDVIWSLEHSFGPEAKGFMVAEEFVRISELVTSIELSGDRDITVISSSPIPGLLSQLFEGESTWFGIMPERTSVHSEDEEAAYDRQPVGTGVMKVVEQVPGTSMALERFEDFYYQPKNGFDEDRRVKFQHLDLVQVPETSTRVAALQSGQADIAPINLSDGPQVEAGGGRIVFGQEGSYLNAYIYGVQFPKHPWSDKRVRDALNLAINKEQMRDSLLGGKDAFSIRGFMAFTPSTIGYTEGLDPLSYDPDQARKLLADAGFAGGASFPTLSLLIQDDGSGPGLVDAGQLAAANWRTELGINVDVSIGDATVIKKQRNSGELSEKGILLWRTNSPRHDPTLKILEILDLASHPYILINDPALYAKAESDAAIFDDAKREAAYKDLLKQVYDQTPAVSIGSYNPVWGVGPRVKSWQPYPLVEIASALHTIELAD
jgi:peptide/nickel transport system substrate-binding protein